MEESRSDRNNTSESTESSYSGVSTSLQENIHLANTLSKFLDDAQDSEVTLQYGVSEPSPTALCRLLSLRSICSTTSSSAEFHQRMRDHPTSFRKIGFGQCGLVYEQPSRGFVIKLARKDYRDALWEDLQSHLRIYQAFSDHPTDCRIPSVYKYISESNSSWWGTNSCFFKDQDGFKVPTMALVTQRILPLPKVVRTTLIDLYCPEDLKASAIQNQSNQDCLARIYLGRSRPANAPKSPNFTLRNFNLHLDQMMALELPAFEYASTIGEALAIIHWSANVAPFDIEFVLGSEGEAVYRKEPTNMPQVRLEAGEVESVEPHTDVDEIISVNFKQRPTRLWVLDFNLCSRWDTMSVLSLGKDKDLIEALVEAFFENDPYFPMPMESNKTLGIDGTDEKQVRYQLWETFSSAYMSRAKVVLEGSPLEGDQRQRLLDLPEAFIAGCVTGVRNGQRFKGDQRGGH